MGIIGVVVLVIEVVVARSTRSESAGQTCRERPSSTGVSTSSHAEARMRGVRVTYTSGGHERSVTYPITLFLCPEKIHGSRTCKATTEG
jgi:hypothetical protein